MNFSIICPTVGRLTLKRTLDSVIVQQVEGDELILVVDGPHDQWVMDTYKDAVSRGLRGEIRCTGVRHNDWGHSCRNFALKYIKPDPNRWICHIDDDDFFYPDAFDKIRSSIDFYKSTGFDDRFFFFQFKYDHGKVMWDEPQVELGRIGTPMFVHRSDLKFGTWSGHYGGDFDFAKSTIEANENLSPVFVKEPIVEVTSKYPPELIFRPNTQDLAIWKSVFEMNEYQLPERMTGQTVLDIGCHTGSFTAACKVRDAAEIWSAETDRENLELALHNVHCFKGDTIHQFFANAVWRSDRRGDRLRFERSNSDNTGCGRTIHYGAYEVPSIQLDTLVKGITDYGRRRLNWLKIDCEGAEWPILFSARSLDLVDNIVGEYHAGVISTMPEVGNLPGIEYSIENLRLLLNKAGFRTNIYPPNAADFNLFFAYRG